VLNFMAPTCPEMIVYFGSEPGFIFEGTKSSVLAIAPSHAAGTVDVTVVTPMGTSATNKGDKFTYSGPEPEQKPGAMPAVSSVAPAHGPMAGFNAVNIKGEHLLPEGFQACVECAGVVVHFGTSSVVVSQGTQDQLLVFAPPHAVGTVHVTVSTNPGATSAMTSADEYTYLP
jgi:hypothetical protein